MVRATPAGVCRREWDPGPASLGHPPLPTECGDAGGPAHRPVGLPLQAERCGQGAGPLIGTRTFTAISSTEPDGQPRGTCPRARGRAATRHRWTRPAGGRGQLCPRGMGAATRPHQTGWAVRHLGVTQGDTSHSRADAELRESRGRWSALQPGPAPKISNSEDRPAAARARLSPWGPQRRCLGGATHLA